MTTRLVVLVLLLGTALAASSQPLILRMAEIHLPEYPTTQGDREFAKRVSELSQGRIQVEVYDSGVLGDELAVLEQLQFGGIDLARVSIASVEPAVPQLAALFMPYLYRNSDHMWAVLTGPIGKQLMNDLDAGNLVGIGWFESGARSFYTSRPVRRVSDLPGLRIRVQESPSMISLIEAFGTKAYPLAFSEVYAALRTGTLDGAENNLPTYFASGHYQAAPYYVVDEHARLPEGIVGSPVAMAELSPRDVALIRLAAADAVFFQRAAWSQYEASILTKLKAAGVTLVEPLDKSEWEKQARRIWTLQSPQVRDLVDRIRKTP